MQLWLLRAHMNRIYIILDRLSELDPLMVGGFLLLAIVILPLIPRRLYYGASLAFLVAWLNVGRFGGLGTIAALAKSTFVLPLVIVWIVATLQKVPRRNAPAVAWVYVLAPLWAAICIATTTDAPLVLAYVVCFFLSACTAMQVVRGITDRQSLHYVMTAYSVGLLVPFGIILYAFLTGGSQHYNSIHTFRFAPFGAAPNQAISMLLQFVVLGVYQLHGFKKFWAKVLPLLVAGMSAALTLKTGSRQGLVLLTAFFTPYVLALVRRPIFLILFAVIGIGSFAWVFRLGGEAAVSQFNRATDLSNTASRDEIALVYLKIIAERPVTGLLGSAGESAILAPEAGTHTHNAFLEMFYWGGALLGGPTLLAAIYTLYAAAKLIWNRQALAIDGACVVVLCSAIAAVYLHGLVNVMIYTSISSWPFFHFFLSNIIVSLHSELKSARQIA